MAMEGGEMPVRKFPPQAAFPFQLPTARRVAECGLLSSLTAAFQVKDASQSSKAEEK